MGMGMEWEEMQMPRGIRAEEHGTYRADHKPTPTQDSNLR